MYSQFPSLSESNQTVCWHNETCNRNWKHKDPIRVPQAGQKETRKNGKGKERKGKTKSGEARKKLSFIQPSDSPNISIYNAFLPTT